MHISNKPICRIYSMRLWWRGQKCVRGDARVVLAVADFRRRHGGARGFDLLRPRRRRLLLLLCYNDDGRHLLLVRLLLLPRQQLLRGVFTIMPLLLVMLLRRRLVTPASRSAVHCETTKLQLVQFGGLHNPNLKRKETRK